MTVPKLSRLELQIMEALWTEGNLSVREIQESFPEKGRPAYTTVQTTVYRLERKRVLERVKKIGNSNIFMASISRSAAQRKLVGDLLVLLGGRIQPVVAHLIQAGKFTSDDVMEAQKLLDRHVRKEKPE